jgi:lysylphosphatidylglycerol synthetase-like protein (DUF2156 family)
MSTQLRLSGKQELALNLLRKYGRNVYSFEILEPGLSYWFSADGESVVAYVDHGLYWMAVGGPICPQPQLLEVANQFAAAARAKNRFAAFFGVSDRFLRVLPEDGGGFDWLQIGEQPLWDPQEWNEVFKKSRKVRNRINRAKRAGISVRRPDKSEFAAGTALRKDSESLLKVWVAEHPLPPMRFIATVDLFSHAEERRFFLAEQEGKVVGLLTAVPIYGLQGWLLEDIIIKRGCAGGTSEALIDCAMRSLAEEEGTAFATLGLVALAGLQPNRQHRHIVFAYLLNWCYCSLNWLYGFQGLYAFRSKFFPSSWEPVYIVAQGKVTFITVRALLMAFAGGWVPFFAARTFARMVRNSGSRKTDTSTPEEAE